LSADVHPLKHFIVEYGYAVLLALLVHGLVFSLLLTTRVTAPVQQPEIEPITSFLYQPPVPRPAVVIPPAPDAAATPEPDNVPSAAPSDVSTKQQTTVLGRPNSAEQDTGTEPLTATQATAKNSESLAQRALNRVAEPDLAAIEQAANTSYQQYLQKQQQPRLTVDRKHWPISQDPVTHVVAQLDDGRQIVRTKEGCRIGDPSKDGFGALMAAKLVPCGDEIKTSELLKQALDKHIKH
jgi:hypothetical protein